MLTITGLAGCGGGGGPKTKVNVSKAIEDLKGTDEVAKENACIDIATAKDASAVSALVPLLKDPNPELRRLAAYALGEIGPKAKEALAEVKLLLGDPDRKVQMQAVNSVHFIDPSSTPGQNVNVMTPIEK